MSLINGALKRAKQVRQQSPFRGQAPPPLEPADDGLPPNYFLRFGLAVLLVAALASCGWFFWKWWRSGEREPATHTAEMSQAESAAKSPAPTVSRKRAIQVSTNIVVRTNAVVPSRAESSAPPASTEVPLQPPPANAAASAAQTNAAAPAPPPSPFADLKLQSIIFRADKPAAVISGEMLFVGDEIRGVRVLTIGRQSVTVERKGETNELRLPRL